jgi:DNA-binding NtrC family response regulator
MKVLLVEQHRDTQEVVQRLLETSGHTVCVCELEALLSNIAPVPELDCAMIGEDYVGGNATTLAKFLLNRSPSMRVTLTSADFRLKSVAERECPRAVFLLKPVTWDAVETALGLN